MKFFFLFMLVAAAIAGYFWYTDEPGSGAWIFCVLCLVIAAGVGIYNWFKFGAPWRDAASLNDRR